MNGKNHEIKGFNDVVDNLLVLGLEVENLADFLHKISLEKSKLISLSACTSLLCLYLCS